MLKLYYKIPNHEQSIFFLNSSLLKDGDVLAVVHIIAWYNNYITHHDSKVDRWNQTNNSWKNMIKYIRKKEGQRC